MSMVVVAALAAVIGAAPECEYASDLKRGQGAPCTGVLISTAVADRCVRLQVSVVPRLQLRISELTETARIERESVQKRLESAESELSDVRALLADPPLPFHRSDGFVALVSVATAVAGGLIGYLIARAL